MDLDKIPFGRIRDYLVDLAFHDQARLTEWLSFGVLLNFTYTFSASPEIVLRDSYASFAWLEPQYWVDITATIGLLQLATIFWRGRWLHEIRFVVNAVSAAFLITLTISFATNGVSGTATITYLMIFLSTFFAGVFLLWRASTGPH